MKSANKLLALLLSFVVLLTAAGISAYAVEPENDEDTSVSEVTEEESRTEPTTLPTTEEPATKEDTTTTAKESTTATTAHTTTTAKHTTEKDTAEKTTKQAVTQSPSEPKTIAETEQPEETTVDPKQAKQEAQKTLDEQKSDLEKRLAESEASLNKYTEDAKLTEEYIDALDERIGILNEALNVLDKQVAASQKKVDELNKQIEPLEKAINDLHKEVKRAKKKYEKLQKSFNKTYDAYCLRMRALYISGGSSVIATLLTSKDISQFFNRLEMIKAVAKSDTALLKEVNKKMAEIVTQQNGLKERKEKLYATQEVLTVKREALKAEQASIAAKQSEIAAKKIKIAEARAESDSLFAEYSKKALLYTEFRNEDEELIKQVDSEIDALLKGLKEPSEVTTATQTVFNEDDITGMIKTGGELISHSDAALSLTYPVPGHYGVSASFGYYSNGRPHSGTDFPCPIGSKVVAAQKGIVITVKRLNYSYGYYVMIYHGTDSKGRKIVTLYAHNSSILVSVGQSVRKGQQIAKSGSTGNSTGPHSHFEVIIDGVKVNSKNYLSKN